MAAARGVTVLHNSRDTIHIVLKVDDTCSSMTAWGRTGRYLIRGSWPAGFSLEKQPKFVMSINLPALAGGVSGKEDQKRPECSKYAHSPPPHYTHGDVPGARERH